MPLGLLLLFAVAQAPCAAAPAVRPCLSAQAEAASPRGRHDPPAATSCARPLRSGVAGHRLKRDTAALAVSFRFEPQLLSHGDVGLQRSHQSPRSVRRGTSRAPPFPTLA
jgi:hypothetical protein